MQSQFGGQVKNMKESWQDYTGTFSFEVMGMSLSGVLNIEPTEVRMEGQFPMAAVPFKGKIESAMRERITELLS